MRSARHAISPPWNDVWSFRLHGALRNVMRVPPGPAGGEGSQDEGSQNDRPAGHQRSPSDMAEGTAETRNVPASNNRERSARN